MRWRIENEDNRACAENLITQQAYRSLIRNAVNIDSGFSFHFTFSYVSRYAISPIMRELNSILLISLLCGLVINLLTRSTKHFIVSTHYCQLSLLTSPQGINMSNNSFILSSDAVSTSCNVSSQPLNAMRMYINSSFQ